MVDSNDRTQGLAPGQALAPGPGLAQGQGLAHNPPPLQIQPGGATMPAPQEVVMVPLPQSQWVVGTPVECNYGAKGE